MRVAAGGNIKLAPGYTTVSETGKGTGTTTTLFMVGSMGEFIVVGGVTDGAYKPWSSLGPVVGFTALSTAPRFAVTLLVTGTRTVMVGVSRRVCFMCLQTKGEFIRTVAVIIVSAGGGVSDLVSKGVSFIANGSPVMTPAVVDAGGVETDRHFFFPTMSKSFPFIDGAGARSSPRMKVGMSSTVAADMSPSHDAASFELIAGHYPLHILVSFASTPW